MEATKKKRKFKAPHSLVLLMSMVLFVALLTWIVPAGQFERVKNEAGKTVIIPGSFKVIESHAISPLQVPALVVDGFIDNGALLMMIMFSGAAFHIVTKSGAFQSAVSKAVAKMKDKGIWFIPILMLLFGALSTTIGVNTFIAFAPLTVLISFSLGLDSMVGAAVIILGGAVGFSSGMFQPSTTLLSQGIAGLELYSGLDYRFLIFVVYMIINIIFLMRYAKRIKAKPELSPMYELDKGRNVFEGKTLDSFGEMTVRKTLIIIVLFATMILVVVGGSQWKWGMRELAAAFLVLGIVAGLLAGSKLSDIAKDFTEGVRKMMGAVMIIGIARSIGNIMEEGMIIDTIINSMTGVIASLPKPMQGLSMLTTNYLINLVLTSGSGQAAVVMPVFLPIADAIGMSRQTVITAFCMGDGFGNYVVPTSSALMGILGAANVPYEKWMSFFWRLFLIWYLVSCAFVLFAPVWGHV
ncbi:MAG: YfcC family protein [Christensenellales bacterium]|jgi:uncharacterized ion transporter superfamily protein YfcC|nr:YfcC family protein [Christensenellaceae bacterium]